jgi:putative phosphoesterase
MPPGACFIMKILVLSDTHGDTSKAEKAIRSSKRIDLIIHLGDYFRDAQKLSAMFPKIPIEYIYGNSDFVTENVPAEKVIEVCGKRIFLTHGHRYSVKWDYERLISKAKEQSADILLFGHTHIPELIINDRFYLLNPGSTSEPRADSDGSYAIIEIDESRIRPRICRV